MYRLLTYALVSLTLTAIGCTSHRESVEQRSVAAKAKYPGETFETVIAELGEPASQEEFRIGDGIGEFQIELLNLYPPDDPETANIVIREARWPDGDDFLVIWFEQRVGIWIAVDAAIMDTSVVY